MSNNKPRIAIVGATGAVGCEFLNILAQRRFPFSDLRLLASARSAGARLACGHQTFEAQELTECSFDDCDLALFSAGASISRTYAPIAVDRGCTVIDNSSAFRMDDHVPLVIPEVNEDVLDEVTAPAIIAVPNCSTIIALVAVTPLHVAVGIDRMVISTYQAISGAGAAAMRELEQQARDYAAHQPLHAPILGKQCLFNVFSHNSAIGADGYNLEETKLVKETHKIWNDESVKITATCVRVPVLRAHCESINITFRKPLSEQDAREVLMHAPGVRVVDDRVNNKFPEPLDVSGSDDVLVGRIRADLSQPPGMGLNLFVAGDQLRKGAALDAVQIAECVMKRRANTRVHS